MNSVIEAQETLKVETFKVLYQKITHSLERILKEETKKVNQRSTPTHLLKKLINKS